MTAEIIIMNKNAIAIASDSFVTIDSEKAIGGVDKIFPLSDSPPMAIMLYRNANFMDIPMDILIKEFCDKKYHYKSNEDYKVKFLVFLEE